MLHSSLDLFSDWHRNSAPSVLCGSIPRDVFLRPILKEKSNAALVAHLHPEAVETFAKAAYATLSICTVACAALCRESCVPRPGSKMTSATILVFNAQVTIKGKSLAGLGGPDYSYFKDQSLVSPARSTTNVYTHNCSRCDKDLYFVRQSTGSGRTSITSNTHMCLTAIGVRYGPTSCCAKSPGECKDLPLQNLQRSG